MKLLGFRSGTPWKKAAAVLYYAVCAVVLLAGLFSGPLVEAGAWDGFVYKVSVLVIFAWMLSPAIFLSDTPLRKRLPLFRRYEGRKALLGMMIVFLLFTYLFAMVESWHTPAYKAAVDTYYEAIFARYDEQLERRAAG